MLQKYRCVKGFDEGFWSGVLIKALTQGFDKEFW